MPSLNSDWLHNLRYCYRVHSRNLGTSTFQVCSSSVSAQFLIFKRSLGLIRLLQTSCRHLLSCICKFGFTHFRPLTFATSTSPLARLIATMLPRIALFFVIACFALLVVGAEDYYKVCLRRVFCSIWSLFELQGSTC